MLKENYDVETFLQFFLIKNPSFLFITVADLHVALIYGIKQIPTSFKSHYITNLMYFITIFIMSVGVV